MANTPDSNDFSSLAHLGSHDEQGEHIDQAARDALEDYEVRDAPGKPDYWPAGVPFDPVEVYFTPEEEAAIDEVWEQIGRETAAKREAAREQRNQRQRERRAAAKKTSEEQSAAETAETAEAGQVREFQ